MEQHPIQRNNHLTTLHVGYYYARAVISVPTTVCFDLLNRIHDSVSCTLKPVTDEQVFYDKFLCDKFYLPSARVYMQQILNDKFSYDKFYLLV